MGGPVGARWGRCVGATKGGEASEGCENKADGPPSPPLPASDGARRAIPRWEIVVAGPLKQIGDHVGGLFGREL